MTGPALGVPGHSIALVVWVSMAVMLLLFLAVVVTLATPGWAAFAVPADPVLAVAVVVSAAGIVAAHLVPPRVAPRDGGRGEITALTRLIVGWSLCEAVAILALLAYLLTRDVRLMPVFAAGAAALVAYFPTRARWERLSRTTVAPLPRGRMVR